MTDSRKIDVFVSHAATDSAWVSEFVDSLKAQGVTVWLDNTDLAPGEPWKDKLEEALREAPILAFIVGHGHPISPWGAFELGAAVSGNKTIIPIVTQNAAPASLPPLLRNRRLLQEPSPQVAGKRVAEVVGHLHGAGGVD
jgi:TIR domain